MPSNTLSGSLTEAKIRNFKPEANTRIYWDSAVKGLGVRVTKGGAKSFVMQYRVAGRSRRCTLAQCAAIPLRKAREIAGAQLLAIRSEGDDPLQRRQDAKAAPTVADGLDRFFGEYGPGRIAAGQMIEATLAKYHAQARLYLYPEIGPLKIENVSRSDVRAMLAKVKGPVQRNRVMALTGRVFATFQEWEWRTADSNPARRIDRTREHHRTRVFSPSDLAAMGAAIDALPCEAYKAALRFLTLTGWRVGEVLSLEWTMVDFENGTANLPHTKTGPALKLVTPLALELLTKLPRINQRVFHPAKYGSLRRRLVAVSREAGVDDARLHDFRRTVATDAGAAGESAFAVRDLLGHSTLAMANRYVQASAPALQVAQRAAAARMAAMLRGDSADVEDIAKHRKAG